MSFVHDLRTTLLFAFAGTLMPGFGLWARARGESVGFWLMQAAVGAVLLALLADGLQRRLRGDPRTRSTDPDARTIAAAAVAFAGLALVGAWSLAAGHPALTWVLLLGGGLVGVGTSAWRLRQLRDQ